VTKMRRWTKEEKDFLFEFAPGHSRKEVYSEYVMRFGENRSFCSIVDRMKYYKIKTGSDGRFKKGDINLRTVKIGTERVGDHGFIEIKVALPNKWRKKHRVIYENHYNVKLNHRDFVIFLDNDKTNFDIENLVLVTVRELFFINKNFDFDNATTELRKSMIALAKANVKLIDVKKNRK
jgi:hypothetical protein